MKQAKTSELADYFGCYPSTVRRKLEELERAGLVTCVHGGAKIVEENSQILSFSARKHINVFEKKKIALQAVKLVSEGDTVFLDASSTCLFLVDYLSEIAGIKVVTNGIETLSALVERGVRAYSTGGEAVNAGLSMLVGDFALNALSSMWANVAFVSVKTVDENGEVYNALQEENAVSRQMLARSDKKVILCDKSRLFRRAAFKLCDLSDVDYFVCDSEVKNCFKTNQSVEFIS